MLIINDSYTQLNNIFKITNETSSSDKFEQRCVRYLRNKYPKHIFSLKGGRNNTSSDILVDDEFFIECKMMENGNKRNGAQSTGFGIRLSDDKSKFLCSSTVENNEYADEIIKYINKNFSKFKNLTNSNSGTEEILLDQSVFAKYIHNYYVDKNVMFFMTSYYRDLIIFKNTVSNLIKYFNIVASVRFLKNGTKDLPKNARDIAADVLKKKFNAKAINFTDKMMTVKISSPIINPYIELDDKTTVYLSKIEDTKNEYRIMKVLTIGSPRVSFNILTIRDQDPKDIKIFEDYM